MDDEFVLTIRNDNSEKHFISHLIRLPFTYQIEVLIDHQKVYFEPDEEGGFRTIKMPWQNKKDIEHIDKSLILEIQQKLNEVLLQ